MDAIEKITPIVVVVHGEPLASSEVIAKGMKAQHASTIKLLRKHQPALERFGPIRFEIRLAGTRQGGGKPVEFAMLNEQQAALLISLMRNTARVVGFKSDLIAEFFRMRDALNQQAQGLWKQMQALIAKEVESKVKASFGSRLMLDRKRQIPFFESEHHRLDAEIQPALPLFH